MRLIQRMRAASLRSVCLLILAALLGVLSGCETGPQEIHLADNRVPSVHEDSSGDWALIVTDRRKNPNLLGSSIVTSDSLDTMVRNTLLSHLKLDDYLKTEAEPSLETGKVLKIEILKAYFNHWETNIEGVMVLRASVFVNGQKLDDPAPAIYRGQRVKLNWSSDNAEYLKVLDACLEEMIPKIEAHLYLAELENF